MTAAPDYSMRRRRKHRSRYHDFPLGAGWLRRLLQSLMILLASSVPLAQAADPVLVIHGGAGLGRGDLDEAQLEELRAAMSQALLAGQAKLRAGRPALEAVTAAIVVLEDAPQFNAGRGAVFTHDGHNELDAAVMDGATRQAGSVAGVTIAKNPILLARAVMEASPHVMLAGPGADAFAKQAGVDIVKPAYFRTERRWQQLQTQLHPRTSDAASGPSHELGTVGAVALDAHGQLAAGTSTGGMSNKQYGRIGDSPVIGAGTYADRGCAVSGTGWGEFYLRTVAAFAICTRIAAGESVMEAAQAVINREIPALGGDGGAIVLTANGSIATPFNTEGMARGWIGAEGEPKVALFDENTDAALSPLLP